MISAWSTKKLSITIVSKIRMLGYKVVDDINTTPQQVHHGAKINSQKLFWDITNSQLVNQDWNGSGITPHKEAVCLFIHLNMHTFVISKTMFHVSCVNSFHPYFFPPALPWFISELATFLIRDDTYLLLASSVLDVFWYNWYHWTDNQKCRKVA